MRKTGRAVDLVLPSHAVQQLDIALCVNDETVFGLLEAAHLRLTKDDLSCRIEARNAYANKRLKGLFSAAGLQSQFSFHILSGVVTKPIMDD